VSVQTRWWTENSQNPHPTWIAGHVGGSAQFLRRHDNHHYIGGFK
jgi:hypothetical protein